MSLLPNRPAPMVSEPTGSRALWYAVAFLPALLAPGCANFEQAVVGPLPVTIGTILTLAPETGNLPPQSCEEAATGVSWTFTQIVGVGAGLEKNVHPNEVSFSPGGFDDDEAQTPLPGTCVFRSATTLPHGTWAVQAHLTFQGTAWSESCTIGPVENFEPCEAPDWVGFRAPGFTPDGPGCVFVVGDAEQCGPDGPLDGQVDAFPNPG